MLDTRWTIHHNASFVINDQWGWIWRERGGYHRATAPPPHLSLRHENNITNVSLYLQHYRTSGLLTLLMLPLEPDTGMLTGFYEKSGTFCGASRGLVPLWVHGNTLMGDWGGGGVQRWTFQFLAILRIMRMNINIGKNLWKSILPKQTPYYIIQMYAWPSSFDWVRHQSGIMLEC